MDTAPRDAVFVEVETDLDFALGDKGGIVVWHVVDRAIRHVNFKRPEWFGINVIFQLACVKHTLLIISILGKSQVLPTTNAPPAACQGETIRGYISQCAEAGKVGEEKSDLGNAADGEIKYGFT
jgi:hypothetical protein